MKKLKIPFIIRNRFLFIFDLIFIFLAYFATAFLTVDGHAAMAQVFANLPVMSINMVVYIFVMLHGKIYTTLWSYATTKDYLRICKCLFPAMVLFVLIAIPVNRHLGVSNVVCVYSAFISVMTILLSRLGVRGLNRIAKMSEGENDDVIDVLMVGAGEGANVIIREINTNTNLNYNIVGMVDDDPQKQNLILNGSKVLGTIEQIPYIAKKYGVEQIIVAIPSASAARRKEILEICAETDCRVKIIPAMESMVDGKFDIKSVRNVSIEDLLGRETVHLDNAGISGYIKDKVIFVTGGGGSIGSELCRQIMKYEPEKLVIIDIYENNAYDLQMELNRLYPDNKPDVLIASVREMERLERIFEKYKPYIVFHAAAHKHVPLMEDSPGEAVKNNVFGTYNVAKCADKYEAKRFVMISTDKAVNPTNVMGATKRICEMIVQCMQQISKTEFVAVRFGNVLGSNGSVIPLFKRQIETGGPVTVTHRDITRFFMTIPEAAQLVLQAASYAKGGEIFVLDMGESVKIYDLAVNLIKLSGLRPGVDIQIEFTGLRPGEKLYEELLMNEEGLKNTSHEKIFIGQPLFGNIELLNENLSKLGSALEQGDDEKLKDVIAEVVPTYVRNKNSEKTTVA